MRLYMRMSSAGACALLLFLLILIGQGRVYKRDVLGYHQTPPTMSRCDTENLTAVAERWRTIEGKYQDLRDDKFTVALSTFQRPEELQHTLNTLLSTKIPSLHEIVVVWNNLDEAPPENFTSKHGVHVRYRVPPRDSLNEKLRPDMAYQTQAILLSDDDVYYQHSDLEYVFQVWREFGRDRLVGALARCASVNLQGDWEYNFCSPTEGDSGAYSMVLTNLAFVHAGFLEYYYSDTAEATEIRECVDTEFNCEDIALNVLASKLTRKGPLLVRGSKQWVNLSPPNGLSRLPGHLVTRSRCLNKFANVVGCMPLVDAIGRIERGYRHNTWYKSLWDTIGIY